HAAGAPGGEARLRRAAPAPRRRRDSRLARFAMAVEGRAAVTARVHGVAAQRAAWPALRAHGCAVASEREHLLARRPEPDPLRLALVLVLFDLFLSRSFFLFLVLGEQLLDLEDDKVAFVLIADRQPPCPPLGKDRFLQAHLLLGLALARLFSDAREDLQD